jgi:hypothetical protein
MLDHTLTIPFRRKFSLRASALPWDDAKIDSLADQIYLVIVPEQPPVGGYVLTEVAQHRDDFTDPGSVELVATFNYSPEPDANLRGTIRAALVP